MVRNKKTYYVDKSKVKFTAKHLKMALLHYLRYKRQMVVATEVHTVGLADVVAYDKNHITEVEVKVTLNDLKREFIYKKGDLPYKMWKHRYINEAMGNKNVIGRSMPNKFFFCVPYYILDKSREIIEENSCQSGIIVYEPQWRSRFFYDKPEESIYIAKRAPLLVEGRDERIVELVNKRSSSELCTLYKNIYGNFDYEHEDQLFFEEKT